MFLKVDYTTEKSINNNKQILSETMQINLNDIEQELNHLEISDQKDIWEKIHIICLRYLTNYYINIDEYFPRVKSSFIYQSDIINFKSNVSNYLLENFKLNLYLSNSNINSINHTFSLNEAAINYYKNYDSNYSNYKNEDIKNKVCNLRTQFKNFKNPNNMLSKHLIFYKEENIKECQEYEIYSNLSDVFIYTLIKWKKCKYNDKNIDKNNSFKSIKNFYELFYNNKLKLNDLYFFERIYNLDFTSTLYFEPTKHINNLSKIDKLRLITILFPVIYLPNVFENYKIIDCFIDLYKMIYIDYDINEFTNGIKKFCLDLSFYFIPLYNMLYSCALDIYCKSNQCDVNIFIHDNLFFKKYVEDYNKLFDTSKLNEIFNIDKDFFKEKNLNRSQEFQTISTFITSSFNIELFNRQLIFDGIGKFNSNIISSIITNRDEYQTKLKKFILSILNSENVDILGKYN